MSQEELMEFRIQETLCAYLDERKRLIRDIMRLREEKQRLTGGKV